MGWKFQRVELCPSCDKKAIVEVNAGKERWYHEDPHSKCWLAKKNPYKKKGASPVFKEWSKHDIQVKKDSL